VRQELAVVPQGVPALDAAGAPNEGERSVGDVGQEPGTDVDIELGEVALIKVRGRVDRALGIRDRYAAWALRGRATA
jgi:hypothetical protein